LLEPAHPDEVAERVEDYHQVVEEISRAIRMVTGLAAGPAPAPGWIAVKCHSRVLAAWLVRAIVMENVMAQHQGETLLLPAGPAFRLQKEIKNVVTAMAKTCHYWTGHVSS